MNKIIDKLKYDSKTGKLFWKKEKNMRSKKTEAGTYDKEGYIVITINKKQYRAHRIAWLLYYGEWPNGQIDHINGIRDDNRIINLRNVTSRKNNQNRFCHRNGKIPGVRYHKNKWYSQIYDGKKVIHIGTYANKEEAKNAYILKLNEIETKPIIRR